MEGEIERSEKVGIGELYNADIVSEPIDIILLTHGRLDDLTRPCIQALYQNTRNLFHLVVVDDSDPDIEDGKDKTLHFFDRLQIDCKNVTYVRSNVPFKSGNQAINVGLSRSNQRFVVVIGNSTCVEPDWDVVAVQMMTQNPKIGVIGLKSLKLGWAEGGDGLIESAGINMTNYMPCDIGRDEPSHRLTVSYPCFSVQWAHVLLRREAVVGNLDENLWQGFVGWDDIDNSLYLRYKGWEVWYCGFGVGYHKTHATRGIDKDEVFQKNRINGEIFYKRWGYWNLFRHLNTYAPEYFPNGEIQYLCDADKLPLRVTDGSTKLLGDLSVSLTNAEAQGLLSLVSKEKDAVLVEVGSWTGFSASIIAQKARAHRSHLWCVDHWKGSVNTMLSTLAKDNDVYKIFEQNIRRVGLWEYITPMVMDSKTANEKFKDASIDFLFLDADHRYQQFKEDLDIWLPKMKQGGIICGHDCECYYSKSSPEVKELINSYLEDDYTGIYHAGVIKGLFDKFNDDYSILEGTRIWYKKV